MMDLRRAERELPAVDACALDSNGKKQVGVVEIVVVKEIFGAREEIAGVERPAAKGNRDAKLVLLIALTVQRNEAQVLIVGGLQERPGNGQQRRALIEMSVEGAENPVQFGNSQRSTHSRTGSILNHAAGKMRLAKAGIQREPRCCLELLLCVDRRERSVGAMTLGRVHVLALRGVVANQTKELLVLLSEAIESNSKVAAVLDPCKRGLSAFVLRAAIFACGTRRVLQGALIVCT